MVRVFYWDVNSDIEKLTANTVSMVASILGNEDIAEQMGYLHEKNITEIMQNLNIQIFRNKKNLHKKGWQK